MYIGLGIFLLVVGAIVSFAVRDNVSGVDLTTVGYILMGGGVLAILLSLVMRGGGGYRSRSVSQVDPASGARVDDTRVDRDGL
jgi:predicted anti-sigma-YlaC factor YlaD